MMDDHQEEQTIIKPPEKTSSSGTGSLLQTIIISLLVSLIVVGVGFKVYDDKYATKIVVIDMKSYMQDLQKMMAEGQIDKTSLRTTLETLNRKLQSLPRNQIIILKDVVVGNVEEFKP